MPPGWLFALYVSDLGAAVLRLGWIVGRLMYITGYSATAEKRHRGFMVQALASGALLIGVLIGIILHIMHSM